MADDESGSNIRELWALPDLLRNYGPSQTGPSESNIGQLLEPQLMPPQFGAPSFPLTRPHIPGAHVTPIQLGAPASPLARLPAPGFHVTPIGDQSTEGLNIVPAAPRAMPLSLRPMPRPQLGAPASPLARLPAPGFHVTPIGDQSTEGLNIVPAAPRAMPLSLRPMPRPQPNVPTTSTVSNVHVPTSLPHVPPQNNFGHAVPTAVYSFVHPVPPRPEPAVPRAMPLFLPRAMPMPLFLPPMPPQFGIMRPPPAPQGSPNTKMCYHWQGGFCARGNHCNFAHGFEELRQIIRHPRYKTRNCPNLHGAGFCPHDDCIFRH